MFLAFSISPPQVVAPSVLVVVVLAVWYGRRPIVNVCSVFSFVSFCLCLADRRVTEELQCLQSAARDAEHCVAEAHSWAQEAAARAQDVLREAAEEASRAS